MPDLEARKRFLVNLLYWAAILALIFLLFKYLINLVMPFFLAYIFAAIMRPLVRLLTNRAHLKENAAAIISFIIFFTILAAILVLISVRLVSTAVDFIVTIPAIYTQTVEPGLTSLAARLEELATHFDPQVVEWVTEAAPNLISSIGSAVSNFSVTLVSRLSSLATALPGSILSTVICIIATLFMSISYTSMNNFIIRLFPESTKELVLNIKNCLVSVLRNYGKSYSLILGMTFAELAVGLLVIGVKRAVLIALLIAIMDIFPVVGTGLVVLPWAVISLIQGNTFRGVGLLVIYVVILVVRQIMEPRIVGKHVGLHPLVTLICMFVGSSLFGGLGLFGLPITAAIILNLNESGVISIFSRDSAPGEKNPAPTE